jgi:hypothetical protein
LSTLPRTSSAFLVFCLVISLSGCDMSAEKEAAKRMGDRPKQTIDSTAAKVGNLMQQGQDSERLKEEQK